MARGSASSEKSERAFRTISEAAEVIGVPQHVLRFWETRFPQLQPLKRGGNRRYYRPADMALLETIRAMLHDRGLTIRGAKLALVETMEAARSAGRPEAPAEPLIDPAAVERAPAPVSRQSDAVDIAVLRAIRDRLRLALAA
jgi:DNA-binding transcriptional MerR regulator